VATKPWRLPAVEAMLVGHRIHAELFAAAAARAVDGAEPRAQNAFKVELLRRTVERALRTVGSRA
jgi:xanthine dehydrogenase YagS FAD-binding subunit